MPAWGCYGLGVLWKMISTTRTQFSAVTVPAVGSTSSQLTASCSLPKRASGRAAASRKQMDLYAAAAGHTILFFTKSVMLLISTVRHYRFFSVFEICRLSFFIPRNGVDEEK